MSEQKEEVGLVVVDTYTFGSDEAAIEMAEALKKFTNKNFKKAFTRAVQNFDSHINNLIYSQMDSHSKAFFLEALMPNIISSFNGIRNNYRGRKNAFHMNYACGKAIMHFRYKINQTRKVITKK